MDEIFGMSPKIIMAASLSSGMAEIPFFNEVDNLRETKYKDDPEMLEVIESYNKHVIDIQSKFENA